MNIIECVYTLGTNGFYVEFWKECSRKHLINLEIIYVEKLWNNFFVHLHWTFLWTTSLSLIRCLYIFFF